VVWRGAVTTGNLPVSSPRLAGIYPLARVSCGTTESYLVIIWCFGLMFDGRPLLLRRMIVSFGFLSP
jgi:hypothetical protein